MCGPPLDAAGLDYFADLEEEDRAFWRQTRERGEEYLLSEFEEADTWVRSGMPDLEFLSQDFQEMLHGPRDKEETELLEWVGGV